MAIAAVKDAPGSIGTVSYNTVTFGVFKRPMQITATDVYDDAERVITHIKYVIRLHTLIYAEDVATENANMDSIQDLLSQPGKQLTIEDVGFDSAFTTLASGSRPDVLWGAKPRVLSMQAMGGQLIWEIVWECEFNCSRHAVTFSSTIPFMAFNYELVYSIDDEGMTTRIISGYAQIAQARQLVDTNALINNLDTIWDAITATQLPGFRRVDQTRRLNAARNRLDFQIVDQELHGGPLPDGIVKCDIDYDFESIPPGMMNWSARLGGTLTVAPGYSPSWAGVKFFAILADKVRKLQAMVAAIDGGVLIPEKVAFGHKMFTRTSHFSVQFRLVACVEELLRASGMWAPVEGTSHETWRASMQYAFGRRGNAEVRFNSSDDRLIELSSNTTQVSIGNDTVAVRPYDQEAEFKLLCENITPEKSYLAYESRLAVDTKLNAVVHKEAKISLTDLINPFGSLGEKLAHVVQAVGDPDIYVVQTVRAMRVKFEPEPVTILSIDNANLTLVAIEGGSEPVTSYFGCPVYSGAWTIVYKADSNIPLKKVDKLSPTICDHDRGGGGGIIYRPAT